MSEINSIESLNKLFPEPAQLVLDKVVSGLDSHTHRFLKACPFAIISTQNNLGHIDNSPRGGQPGFILALDDQTLLLPEYAGNHRIDTLKNLIQATDKQIGLLCLVPGIGETLRIKGTASLHCPADNDPVFQAFSEKSASEAGQAKPTPKVSIKLTIHTLYFQCAAALKLSRLWKTDSHQARQEWPSIYQIIEDQIKHQGQK